MHVSTFANHLSLPQGIKKTFISADLRPVQIATWIRGRRPTSGAAGAWSIRDLEVYVEQWRVWWLSLQPGWRLVGDLWPPVRDEVAGNGWESLSGRYGKNGIVIVVLSLFFWAQALDVDGFEAVGSKDPKMREEFSFAVDDVCWVLDRLTVVPARGSEVPGTPASVIPSKRSAPGNSGRKTR